ncbi:hypothetical protein PhaeoP23_03570 (plasmid) [Phaeobacter piscinae]|uniref:Uncharacterized protein n=1 Tax=Phaeobacter piscinae TaxID=1580596 RepID=A0ABM6PJ00_9RHOB|nr:hypothetical protein [Phaeobacter piscinae]ATG37648.1 hypothetical protein PhaeoP36_03570 [Phaeobacter piscinae]AUQ88169.1 hypothetical protein PhaeoP42_03571 [Phaeobacter piscinae]AUR26052.1 hypothetical protein PhaeoP23_03570 [Phaeobacter piscinae]
MTSSPCAKAAGAVAATAAALTLMALPALAVDKPSDATRAVSSIDWAAATSAIDAASADDRTLTAAFLATEPDGFDDMAMAVMILGANTAAGLPVFRGQGNAYAAYYQLEGVQVSVMGSRTHLVDVPGLSFKHEARSYESTGDGADHMLSRFGGTYTLRITCDAPTEDVRCIKPDYLAELAGSLTVVKGADQ